MDIRTFEYKMRDRAGLRIAKDLYVWRNEKKHPIMIDNLKKEDEKFYFNSYQEMYEFTLPDGRKVKNLIDRLTDDDFKMVLR